MLCSLPLDFIVMTTSQLPRIPSHYTDTKHSNHRCKRSRAISSNGEREMSGSWMKSMRIMENCIAWEVVCRNLNYSMNLNAKIDKCLTQLFSDKSSHLLIVLHRHY